MHLRFPFHTLTVSLKIEYFISRRLYVHFTFQKTAIHIPLHAMLSVQGYDLLSLSDDDDVDDMSGSSGGGIFSCTSQSAACNGFSADLVQSAPCWRCRWSTRFKNKCSMFKAGSSATIVHSMPKQ